MFKSLLIILSFFSIVFSASANTDEFQLGEEVLVGVTGYYDDEDICEIISFTATLEVNLICRKFEKNQPLCQIFNFTKKIKDLKKPNFTDQLPSAKKGDLLFSKQTAPYTAKKFIYKFEDSNNEWTARVKDQNNCWHETQLYPSIVEYNNFPPFGPAMGDSVLIRSRDEATDLITVAEKSVVAHSYEYFLDSFYGKPHQPPQNLPPIETFDISGINYLFTDDSYANLKAIFQVVDTHLESKMEMAPGDLFIDGELGNVRTISKVRWNGCPATFGGDVCDSYLGKDFKQEAVVQDQVSGKWYGSYNKFHQKFSKVIFVKQGDFIKNGKVKLAVNAVNSSGEKIISIQDPDFASYHLVPEFLDDRVEDLSYSLEKHAVVVTDQLKKYFVFQCDQSSYYDVPDFALEVQLMCAPDSQSGLLPISIFAIEL